MSPSRSPSSDRAASGQGAAGSTGQEAGTQTIAETLSHLEECSLISDALKSAGLEAVLDYPGPHTLFIPTDGVISDQPPADIYEFIHEHLVDGAIVSQDLLALAEVTCFSGQTLPVTHEEGGLRVGGEMLQRADVRCSNGIIHIMGGKPTSTA